MKKITAYNPFRIKQNIRMNLVLIRTANVRRHQEWVKRRKEAKQSVYLNTIKFRKAYVRKHYKMSKKLIKSEDVIIVPENFGIELEQHADSFFSTATRISQSQCNNIIIDFSECKRVWPSAITFLCSYSQWVSSLRKSKITVSHIAPKDMSVLRYLDHCGFLDYVGVNKPICEDGFGAHCVTDIVKIKHEKSKGEDATVPFEENICGILRRCTNLSEEDIERFNSIVLTEIILNVTEHGMPILDAGWWAIAQHHPKTGIVSICVADNGIGIRKSLMTGHQRHVLSRELSDKKEKEGLFIKKALTENVSGAIDAALKTPPKRFFQSSQYAKGNRRGFGLHRIRAACQELGFRFSIVSNTGALMIDSSGREILCSGYAGKVFAGTMYHIIVPDQK